MWLIHEDTARTMREMRRASVTASAAQHAEMAARVQAAAEGDPRNMTRAGDAAEIRVVGVLTKVPDWFAMYYGGGNTSYVEIERAIAQARADSSIKSVQFYVDSPGGMVDGLFDVFAAIESLKAEKKVTVRAAAAQSAAYGIAALAGPIEATNVASPIGSIGVAVTYFVDEDLVTITNADSPDKRPDVTTPEGRAVVQRELDAINDLFVDAIARGRGTKSKDVVENFGRGATFVAGEAQRRGMIDKVAKSASKSGARAEGDAPAQAQEPTTTAEAGGAPTTEKTMKTIEELRAQHPELYAAAVAEGVTTERKRCCAHLKLAKSSGAVETAHKYIASGESTMDEEVHAEYMSAGMNRSAQTARQADSDSAGAALEGAPQAPLATPAKDAGDVLVEALKAQRSTGVMA